LVIKLVFSKIKIKLINYFFCRDSEVAKKSHQTNLKALLNIWIFFWGFLKKIPGILKLPRRRKKNLKKYKNIKI
jgi:hypothetical protein